MYKHTIPIALLAIICLYNCGLGSYEICPESTHTTDTKYRTLYVGPCAFSVELMATIPPNYAHYADDEHEFSATYGKSRRASRGLYTNMAVTVPCSACEIGITGKIAVQFDKGQLIPWGCGGQVPPLNVNKIAASFTPKNGATPIDKAADASWKDTPPPTFEYEFNPGIIADESACDGDFVLFDLTPACEVLVNAGVMENLEK